jgi:hypothetical protein
MTNGDTCRGSFCEAEHLRISQSLAIRSRATAREWLAVVHRCWSGAIDVERLVPIVNQGLTPIAVLALIEFLLEAEEDDD